MRFAKYHGLGNDYLVVEPDQLPEGDMQALVPRICDRHFGIGGDGVLVGGDAADGTFSLRIINPDGSEAEKSGNGLRIFARYLWDRGRVGAAPFQIRTAGGVAHAQVNAEQQSIRMTMGRAHFDSEVVGIAGPQREVVRERLLVQEETFTYCGVSVGNPHCVLLDATSNADECKRLGPHIENDPRFLRRTNVQLLRVMDRHNLSIQIWERGAGYTLASGSSASAAAAAAVRVGLCQSPVSVHMPGGVLQVEIDDHFDVVQTGPAVRIGVGVFNTEESLGGSWRQDVDGLGS